MSILTSCTRLARSHGFVIGMSILGLIIIVLGSFAAGMSVGYHKADFSYRLDQNYGRTFGAPGRPFAPERGFPDPHAAMGSIVSVSLPNFVITRTGHAEQTIHVGTTTAVRKLTDTVSADTLVPGTIVVVFGTPQSDGSIDADLIRIMPSTETSLPAAH